MNVLFPFGFGLSITGLAFLFVWRLLLPSVAVSLVVKVFLGFVDDVTDLATQEYVQKCQKQDKLAFRKVEQFVALRLSFEFESIKKIHSDNCGLRKHHHCMH